MSKINFTGQTVELYRTFYDASGTPTNPSTVTLSVTAPSGAAVPLTPASEGDGLYTATLTADEAGTWVYVWEASGNGVDHVWRDSFDVLAV